MAFLDVWNNKVNNVDNVMADDVNLLAEYISRNENNIETIKQNIKNISYAEVDSFSSGYAVVEDTKTIDSSEGPILINFVYPLFAETVETFGNVEINQIRIYNGELQKRTVGKEWEKINTYSLEYKGSLESTDSLPGNNSKGDVYNIETESDIAIKVQKTKHLIPCSGAIDSGGELFASYDETYDSWLNQDDYIELFDMSGNSLAVGVIAIRSGGQIIIQGTGLEEGTQVYYIQLQNQADNKEAQGDSVSLYETKNINIKPKQKLFYNGIDWDLFSDLSNCAEKATTLSGYGITDAYTKEEVDAKDNALKDDISDLKQKSIPHTTASGYPMTVTDHLEGEKLINYQVYGNSVQDGTPTPETPIEIQSVGDLVTDGTSEHYGKYDVPVTVCGKNLLPNDWELGFISTSSGANQSSSTYVRTKDYFAFDISKNYYISSDSIDASTPIGWYFYDENKNFISRFVSYKNRTIGTSGCQVAIPTNTVFFRLTVLTTDINIKVQIEEGSNATSYEPYIPPVTKHIYLDEPLRKAGDYADYVDFENQRAVRKIEVLDNTGTKTIDESLGILATPTEEPITAPELTAPNSDVMHISSGTATQPSHIDLTYYKDINKVITNLTNAILAQGGNV